MDLSVQKREKLGKAVKAIRREGLIPAELYGNGIENEHLSVSGKEFEKVFKEAGTNTIINLVQGSGQAGQAGRPVIIHGVDRDYLSGMVAHIDFYQVRMDKEIRAMIPIVFVGESPLVKDGRGVLNTNMSEVEVESRPGNLPHKFEVDLSLLTELGQSIHLGDLKAPDGVEFLVDKKSVVVGVVEPQKEEVAPVAETEVDLSAIKVEGEEKKTERDAEKKETGVEEKKKK